MAAIDDFQAALTSAATYLSARDFPAARTQVILARIHLAKMPNTAADGVSAQWRADLDGIEKAINAESGRVQRSATALCEFTR
jgi:hypothetical protein